MGDTPSFSSRTEFDFDAQERLRHRVLEAHDAETGLTVEVSHVAGADSSGDWHVSVPDSLDRLQLLRLPELIEAALRKARKLRWMKE